MTDRYTDFYRGCKLPEAVRRRRRFLSYPNHHGCYPPPVLPPLSPKAPTLQVPYLESRPEFPYEKTSKKTSDQSSAQLQERAATELPQEENPVGQIRKSRSCWDSVNPFQQHRAINDTLFPSTESLTQQLQLHGHRRFGMMSTVQASYIPFPMEDYYIQKDYHRTSAFSKTITLVHPYNPFCLMTKRHK